MEVGFYGKLPSHGDFLRRRVSDAFVDVWDRWLREGLVASRSALGVKWLDIYLTSPAWRFVCAAGTCGPHAVIGLMAPSVDRVGRYFPLTLVYELPPDVSLLAALASAAPFFDRAERLLIETLASEPVDFERFDALLCRIGEELGGLGRSTGVVLEPEAAALFTADVAAWHVPLGSSEQLTSMFVQMLALQLSSLYQPLVVWWSEGSAAVAPSCLVSSGLPSARRFAALLDGAWQEHHWQSAPTHVIEDAQAKEAVVAGASPFRFQSAAATDVGHGRSHNEDGFIERSAAGLWAVADGLGGYSGGEVASRMVCDALADFEPAETFEATIEATRQRIQQVNDHLFRAGRDSRGQPSGSTVVVLLVRGEQSAVLWAGDSRLYRFRTGQLEQLSRDHSLKQLRGVTSPQDESVITRAVGVETSLSLDLHCDVVHAEDRFLLCSDGLTRVVGEDHIARCLESQDIRVAASGLIQATLEGGAPDNVTVLIVEALADAGV